MKSFVGERPAPIICRKLITPISDCPYRAIEIAGQNDAPYLDRLLRRRADLASALGDDGPEQMVQTTMAAVAALDPSSGEATIDRELRLAKDAIHLAVAAADLCGQWTLWRIMRVLSDFADLAVEKALATAWSELLSGDRVTQPLSGSGLFVLALGKLGAYELNYSSDIDLVVFFDPEHCDDRHKMREAAIRAIRKMVRILHNVNNFGYVFRVDLRLRPDPGSTPIAVSTEYALEYYESVGQNWERMALTKARFCAGDSEAAAIFLQQLSPFIWRRHLDYWAIEDIRAISAQIHAGSRHHLLEDPAFDVKLGRGGIREVEFLAQTRQLILGGREACLRVPGTCPVLSVLADLSVLTEDTANELVAAYKCLRMLEHRIQMRQDEQTHFLPANTDSRAAIARLCGFARQGDFDELLLWIRQTVHDAYVQLFEPEESLSGRTGNLVFTGIDDDPDTVLTLSKMGFSNASAMIDTIRGWHRGGLLATRTTRGRELFTRLTPRLLEAAASTGAPDTAWAMLSNFLSGLKAGVQVFSLLLAEPELSNELIATMSYAPQLGRDLVCHPDLLEAMLDSSFDEALRDDPPEKRLNALSELTATADLEEACDRARQFKREEALRIGYQLLKHRAGIREIGAAYANLAESCIHALSLRVLKEIEDKYGKWNAKWAICALGGLGGSEMTAISDLDLMLVHEPEQGSNDLSIRFVRRLISALSAQTMEGMMYEVDMRLRPSGQAGPIAVKMSAFAAYYQEQAWTWEYMAMTRMRPIVGSVDLCVRLETSIIKALAAASARKLNIKADMHEMRLKLAKERPPDSEWDMKLSRGGLLDAEFIIQQAILENIGQYPDIDRTSTLDALTSLSAIGAFTDEESRILKQGICLQQYLAQALSVADTALLNHVEAPEGFKTWLCSITGHKSFQNMYLELQTRRAATIELFQKKIAP